MQGLLSASLHMTMPNLATSTLLLLIAVIVAGRVLSAFLRHIGQPPVIGEILAGILLGPSCLGWLWPAASQLLLPAGIESHLSVLAQLGVVLYMFQLGLELNHSQLNGRTGSILIIAIAGIALPFMLGAALGVSLFPDYAGPQQNFWGFILFVAVALSVTALPVLARILQDHSLQSTPLGGTALACAAVADVTAWCLLSAVVAITQARPQDAIWSVIYAFAFVVIALRIVRPMLLKVAARDWHSGMVVLLVVGVLSAALITEMIGLHLVFGAFVLGALIPHDSALARGFDERFRDVTTAVLLPAFFAVTGLRLHLQLLDGWQDWAMCGGIIALATLGKFTGTVLAARGMKMPWREASALGALMNTRGLVELIVLNIGLELGVISPRLFAMLVIMALATTLMTAPALHAWGYPARAKRIVAN